LLPRLPGARGLWRLQAVGHRPRKPPDDAASLPADQEPAGQLQPEEARLLLIRSRTRRLCVVRVRSRTLPQREAAMPDQVEATEAALKLIDEIRADHGPVIFHQSGGCCDGSAPMCLAAGDLMI